MIYAATIFLSSLLLFLVQPLLVEPYLSAREQVSVWSWLFAGFALLCAALAWRTPRPAAAPGAAQAAPALAARDIAWWLALSATGSVMLLAVTNHLTQNVASVPLLWLVPLALYLATFIIAFEGARWYQPRFLWPLLLVALVAMAWLLVDTEYHYQLALPLGVFLSGP